VVSTEFPVFEIDETRVLPEVLDVYFRDPEVWPRLSGRSTGTNVRRRRLNPADFLKYKFPLPPRYIQDQLRQVVNALNHLRLLQSETAAELDALLPSVLNRAFAGEL
jgi:type I restriction enzyme S subunit